MFSWEMALGIFVVYSIIGWTVECIYAAINKKTFVNRGLLAGPFCPVYGIGMVFIATFLRELIDEPLVLFIASTVVAGFVEWVSGIFIEKAFGRRMWDYSDKKFNLNGYTCLQYALLFGLCATLSMVFIFPWLEKWFAWVPKIIIEVVFLILFGIIIIDFVGTAAVLLKIKKNIRLVPEVTERLEDISSRMNKGIVDLVAKRMELAFPQMRITKKEKGETNTVFAKGCSFYKLVWIFIFGSLAGAIVEMIFCRISMGFWMSRSSLLYGPFSVIWGFGCVLFTAFLYQARNKNIGMIFISGTIMGGTYEYICSVLSELVFGSVFWDYSHLPLNIGGRINLLYCFFWGIAAVLWMKAVYPLISKWIEKIPKKIGPTISWICIVCMTIDMLLSGIALMRYSSRNEKIEPRNVVEQFLDNTYPDDYMEHRYQNMKLR